jgi:hypothetical protein
MYISPTIRSDVTAQTYLFRTAHVVEDAVFTLPVLYNYAAGQGTFGASATVTSQYGFAAISSMVGATNNYGFSGSLSAAAGRYNLYMSGSAANYLAGATTIANTLILDKANTTGIKVDSITPTYPWRDLIGNINVDAAEANAPTLSAFMGGSVRRWAFSATDKADIEFHLPHDYAMGTDLYIHYHWSHNGTAISGNIVATFAYTYAKGHNQATFSAEKTITSTYNTVNIATTPRYQHRLEEVQLSSAGGSATLLDTALLEPDGILGVNFTMTTIPTITGGTPNEPFILFIDIHYQSTSLGTKAKSGPTFWT